MLSESSARYGRLDLLCLDELGYVHLDPRGAELLFQVLTERDERASIAVASNAPFSEWGQTFTDPAPGRRGRRPADVPGPHPRDRLRLLSPALHTRGAGAVQAEGRARMTTAAMTVIAGEGRPAEECRLDVVARALDQDESRRVVACCLASAPEDAGRRVDAPRREPPLDR